MIEAVRSLRLMLLVMVSKSFVWTDCLGCFEEKNLPGVCLAALLGMTALWAGHCGELSPISSQMWYWRSCWECWFSIPHWAVFWGLRSSVQEPSVWSPGLRFTDKKLLRLAIVLMGLKVQADLFEVRQIGMVFGHLGAGSSHGFLACSGCIPAVGASSGNGGLAWNRHHGLWGLRNQCTQSCDSSGPARSRNRHLVGVSLLDCGANWLFLWRKRHLSAEFGGLWAGLAVNDLSSSVAVGSQLETVPRCWLQRRNPSNLMLGPLLVFFSLLRNQDAAHGEGRGLSTCRCLFSAISLFLVFA